MTDDFCKVLQCLHPIPSTISRPALLRCKGHKAAPSGHRMILYIALATLKRNCFKADVHTCSLYNSTFINTSPRQSLLLYPPCLKNESLMPEGIPNPCIIGCTATNDNDKVAATTFQSITNDFSRAVSGSQHRVSSFRWN